MMSKRPPPSQSLRYRNPQQPQHPAPPPEAPVSRRAYRVKEVTAMLGLPKTTVHDLIRRGDIHAVGVGSGPRKIILVPAGEIDRLLAPARRIVDQDQLLEQIMRVTATRPM